MRAETAALSQQLVTSLVDGVQKNDDGSFSLDLRACEKTRKEILDQLRKFFNIVEECEGIFALRAKDIFTGDCIEAIRSTIFSVFNPINSNGTGATFGETGDSSQPQLGKDGREMAEIEAEIAVGKADTKMCEVVGINSIRTKGRDHRVYEDSAGQKLIRISQQELEAINREHLMSLINGWIKESIDIKFLNPSTWPNFRFIKLTEEYHLERINIGEGQYQEGRVFIVFNKNFPLKVIGEILSQFESWLANKNSEVNGKTGS